MPNEEQLVKKSKNGDRKALSDLLGKYQSRIYAYLYRILNNHHDAEEATQETFVRVIKNIDRYREEGYFKSWLFKVAYREGLRKLRDRDIPVDSEAIPEKMDFSTAPDKMVFTKERMAEITAAIEKLPVLERQVVLLRSYSGFSFQEIADLMESPLSTALGRMRNATARLRKILK